MQKFVVAMSDAEWWQLPALCLFLWFTLHALAWRLLRAVLMQMGDPDLCRRVAERHACLTAEQQRYLRHLVRSQVYYIGAALAGAYLMLGYDTPESLVRRFTGLHQVAFSAALAHWLTAFWEDTNTYGVFYLFEHHGRKMGGGILYLLYLAHHAAAAIFYGYCLRSQLLSSVGTIGLLYEASCSPHLRPLPSAYLVRLPCLAGPRRLRQPARDRRRARHRLARRRGDDGHAPPAAL